MKTLLIYILTLTFSVSSTPLEFPDHLIKKYLNIKDALVKGDAPEVTEQAIILLEMINQEEDFPEKANLIKSVDKLTRVKDLEKQRKEFAVLSPLMWELAKADSNQSSNLYYQYCPMKKAYWLSEEAVIKNPYYGNKMLTCGNVSDSLSK